MAKLSIDAEFALHEFSVQYREALAQEGGANDLQSFLGAVKEQFAEQQAAQTHGADASSASHQQEQQHDHQREAEGPEAGE